MPLIRSIMNKLGLNQEKAERDPIRVFLLDDDKRRHEWFSDRFKGDYVAITENVESAKQVLSETSFDAIFLDHDLLPEHYNSATKDDERTGYAIATWLASNPQIQRASTILVHTRNADGAIRMVEILRGAGRNADFVPFPMLADRIKRFWAR